MAIALRAAPLWGFESKVSRNATMFSISYYCFLISKAVHAHPPPEVWKGDFYNSINVLPEKTLSQVSGDFVLVFFIFL